MIAVWNHRYKEQKVAQKALKLTIKLVVQQTLSWGGSHCSGSASLVKSGDLRAYYNWVVSAVGGAVEWYKGALFSMRAVHTLCPPSGWLSVCGTAVEGSGSGLFSFLFFFSQKLMNFLGFELLHLLL